MHTVSPGQAWCARHTLLKDLDVTNRERVLAAVSHRSPDKVPYDIRFTQPAHARMVAYYGDPGFESKLGNCFTWLRPHRPTPGLSRLPPTSGRTSSASGGTGTSTRISAWSATGW